jgi:beta-barrel assembly-enhancing protease
MEDRLGMYAELHAELVREYGTETEPWALERVRRVSARLDALRPDGVPLAVEVLWVRPVTAFVTPGGYVYISRRLLERLPTDEAVAFVLAHEAGHLDCGHLESMGGWAEWLPRNLAGEMAAAMLWRIAHRLHGPERESEADVYAVELCLDAGYDGALCLQAFDTMINLSLDRGDVDGVYGPEPLLDEADPGFGGVGQEIQRWLWTRGQRYLPLRERRRLAWERLRERARKRL